MSEDLRISKACQTYFEVFLPTLLGQLLIDDLRTLSCSFGIRIAHEDGPPWQLDISEGRLARVERAKEAPACCFVCDGQTLIEVASAKITPQEAFFAMRVEVEGDMELGLKLSTVLAPFFSRYPFHP